MKVLFLLPPAEHSLRKADMNDNGYGLGRAYLMSYLKSHWHEVSTIPFNFRSDEYYLGELDEQLKTFKPDFVAITMFSVNRVMGYKCVDYIHILHPEIKIVVGGHHASAEPEQLIEKYPFIQVVKGEGEIALLDIVEGRETGKIVERPLIKDLDSLPFPDHKTFFDAEPGRKSAIILTSRGCPNKPACSFCCLPTVSHATFRKRSAQNVFEEIKWMKETLPNLKIIGIVDDAFTTDHQRVIDLCKLLVENNIKLEYAVSVRVKPVSDEMLYWMDKAGMYWISIGLETGNQKMLDSCHKRVKLEEFIHYFKLAKKYPKLCITTFLMVGLPGETWDTVKETVKFVKKLHQIKYDLVFDVAIVFVYAGGELEQMMVDSGKHSKRYWVGDGDCPTCTLEHDENTLKEMRRYILYRISFLRVFTPLGFFHQFLNAPRNLLELFWNHPEMIKYSLGDSFSIMFPKLYRKLRGDKIERRYEL